VKPPGGFSILCYGFIMLTARQISMRRDTRISTENQKKRQKTTAIGAAAHNDQSALSPAQQLGSLGGAARARRLTAEQRREIAQKAAAKRWER
jgi:hypothetical protein